MSAPSQEWKVMIQRPRNVFQATLGLPPHAPRCSSSDSRPPSPGSLKDPGPGHLQLSLDNSPSETRPTRPAPPGGTRTRPA